MIMNERCKKRVIPNTFNKLVFVNKYARIG